MSTVLIISPPTNASAPTAIVRVPLLHYALAWVSLLLACLASTVCADSFETQRSKMIELIRQDVIETSQFIGTEKFDLRVMSVMARVPRHEFVPKEERAHAYENRPLPIGHGQTISQPYIVALMTDLLKVGVSDRVLEIGTGSGYQAAVLAELVREVRTIEIIEPLGHSASARLLRLGYSNIHSRIGDGYYGWPEYGPYDAIIVTAAAGHVPPPLLTQLRPGGRLVIPVGSRFFVQDLLLVKKNLAGQLSTRQILPVRFVPLTGGH